MSVRAAVLGGRTGSDGWMPAGRVDVVDAAGGAVVVVAAVADGAPLAGGAAVVDGAVVGRATVVEVVRGRVVVVVRPGSGSGPTPALADAPPITAAKQASRGATTAATRAREADVAG